MINRHRAVLPFIMMFVLISAICTRLFIIQIWHHDELMRQVEKLIRRERPEIPCRGMILDRQGRVLAMSLKTYTLFIDPTQVKDKNEVASNLKRFNINLPKDIFNSSKKLSYLPLQDNVDAGVMEKIKSLGISGVGFHDGYLRCYPEGRMASHLLGIVGRDGYGLEGVELCANGYLSGDKIKELRFRDGRGREISEKLITQQEIKGADVYLTLDANLQFIAEQEIEKIWLDSSAKKAIAIIQDPNTGEILAMACRPDFDPRDFGGSWNNLRNPAISDIFEPGSTFKIVTAAAAMEEKVMSSSDVIYCEDGKYKVYGHTIKDHEKKGFLTFEQVIEYSSNIGIAKVAERVGKDNLYRYARQFGFYSQTGIDLPGEAKGLLKSPGSWSGLSLPAISFGQEIGVTAIQIVNAYSSIANGGYLLEPKIIREIKNSCGETVYSSERRVIRKVVSSDVVQRLKNMLIGVVEKGTGQLAKIDGYRVGGKTGTAQKKDPQTGRYSSSAYIASFCGIVPMSMPKLTVIVVLDEPKGDYYAASRAAPVFNRITSRALAHLRIPPDKTPVRKVVDKQYVSVN